jgi:hypothetical protein
MEELGARLHAGQWLKQLPQPSHSPVEYVVGLYPEAEQKPSPGLQKDQTSDHLLPYVRKLRSETASDSAMVTQLRPG